jgi:hypothetical protein
MTDHSCPRLCNHMTSLRRRVSNGKFLLSSACLRAPSTRCLAIPAPSTSCPLSIIFIGAYPKLCAQTPMQTSRCHSGAELVSMSSEDGIWLFTADYVHQLCWNQPTFHVSILITLNLNPEATSKYLPQAPLNVIFSQSLPGQLLQETGQTKFIGESALVFGQLQLEPWLSDEVRAPCGCVRVTSAAAAICCAQKFLQIPNRSACPEKRENFLIHFLCTGVRPRGMRLHVCQLAVVSRFFQASCKCRGHV